MRSPRAATSTIPAAAPSPSRRPRILVIEDERHVRALLRDLLSGWGWQVDMATGGRAGLALFDQGLYDVVLTDLGMPELSGLDVVAGVRERDAAVPVILFTGSLRSLDGEEHRLGFRVLHKPLDIEHLRQALQESLPAGRGD